MSNLLGVAHGQLVLETASTPQTRLPAMSEPLWGLWSFIADDRVRRARVERIQWMVQAGSYQVASTDLADRMLTASALRW
ncbi:MAG: flagellar biosynthesis anti-sigma factor FlgM [Actinobacteria bacterium]|nr:flagellar biosynthesis anti-sigma factor FlgM [Actinomycetota bacterium]MCB9389112.1 flagellar biosynthesis anti-sigma factor FlgM [Acidimicrobiia bacterium]